MLSYEQSSNLKAKTRADVVRRWTVEGSAYTPDECYNAKVKVQACLYEPTLSSSKKTKGGRSAIKQYKSGKFCQT